MAQSFHAVDYHRRDGVAVITMNNPPVNGLSHSVRLGLKEAFEHAIRDPEICGVVLTGADKAFSAGGDIRELGTPAATAAPALSLQLHPIIESCAKPTVAALHGIAMGGGLETALVCHYRVAAADTRIALPEIQLGLIPPSGTQRLPRLVGLETAIDFILESKRMQARQFPAGTLFDEVLDAPFDAIVARGVELALTASREKHTRLPLVRNRAVEKVDDKDALLSRARNRATELGPAAIAALEAILASSDSPDFDIGMTRAREIYDALSASDAVRQHRDRFLMTPEMLTSYGAAKRE